MTALTIDRIRLFALHRAVERGPFSSLAAMPSRNGLLVELTDADGAVGWGEAWCNFPPAGNLAKLALMRDVIAPAVLGRPVAQWIELRPWLEASFERMTLHVGEPGPFAHCLAALDTAVADLAARAAGLPLARFLSPSAGARVPVYASTPNVDRLDESVGALLAAGHDAVKLKVGFGSERDVALLARFRELAPAPVALMVDANQNWSPETALAAIAQLAAFGLDFVEEPLRADLPLAAWRALALRSPAPLAAGENINSVEHFTDMIGQGGLAVAQPDLAKWGGVSGAMAVGRAAAAAGARCAMHYMGTAIGLAASLQVLAAIGGTGRVELDANPNPLRTELGPLDLTVVAGHVALPDGAGIGLVPDRGALKRFTVAQCDLH
jgi:L-alanine-DL-glutamate epimerase-like enolase superfamily enzyme